MVTAYGMDQDGRWVTGILHPEGARSIRDVQRSQIPSYRSNLAVEDAFGEYERFKARYGIPILSVLDVPFSAGTLAVNSVEVDAFTPEHIDILQSVGRVMGEGLQRLDDLQTLQDRTAAAEVAQKEASLLYRASEAAADADFDGILQNCIDMVCDLTGWPIGHAYVPNDAAEVLQSTSIWHLPGGERHGEFRTVTEQTPFASGIGLPGGIWASGKAAWIVNVQEDPNFPRNQLCRDLSVKGAFGFPVVVDGSTVAVLEFFSEQEMVEDPPLLRTLRAVGEQVGRLVERRQAREALRIAKEEAEEANRAKSTFLANMSHELRSPLNAILGFAQLLDRSAHLDGEEHDNLGIIHRSGEHLLALINDVLELSRIEAGRTVLEETAFDVYQLFESLGDMFRLRAEGKGLQLICEYTDGVPRYARADEGKLRQILINLLGNAVKFTEEGGVALRAQWSEGRLFCEVEDTGPGIAADELPTLFEPFVQTQSGRQAHTGTGLGLAISQQFAQLMGGQIAATSREGKGSTFRLDLPMAAAEAAELPDAEESRRVIGLAKGHSEWRVLVVDDVEDNRLLLRQVLEPVGFAVREAQNGQQAIEVWQTWQPHLICMDMRMPVLDGYAATRQIKELAGGQTTKIIALTASAFTEDRQKVLDAGCDDFVRKPLSEQELFEKMREHLGLAYVYEGEEQGAVAPTELTREALAVLPAAWRRAAYEAAEVASEEQLEALLVELDAEHAALGATLIPLVRDFRFDEIMDLTR